MTSKASLARKRKCSPLLHTVLWTVRRYWWLALAGYGLFLFMTLGCIKLMGTDHPDFFALFSRDWEVSPQIAALGFGFLAAFVLFRFLWSKKENGAYLTVGVARWKQFLIRYLYGVLVIILSVVTALLTTYHAEIQAIGEDYYGIAAHYTAVFTVSLTALTLLTYTALVLVNVLCGHFLPALFCTAGVVAAPYTVAWAIQRMLSFYLFGSPLGAASSAPYTEEIPNFFTRSLNAGLFTMLSEQLTYVTYPAITLNRHDDAQYGDIAAIYKEEMALPALTVVLLLAVITVLALLAGFAFCRRPAEHAGKHTVHPVLSHAVSLTVGIGGAATVLSLKAPVEGILGTVLLTALFLVAFMLAAALIRLILIRDFRNCIKHYPVLGGAAAFVLAVVICLGTGWFGYEDYIPATEDIESVVVSYNQHPDLIHMNGRSGFSTGMQKETGSFGFSDGDMELQTLYAYGVAFDYGSLPVLTSTADIETARAIHGAVLASGRQTYTGEAAADYRDTVVTAHCYITYQLKNGKTVTRYYQYLTLETLEATVSLEDTEAFRAEIADYHEDIDIIDGNAFEFGDPLFAYFTAPTLTEEEQAALLVALDTDMAEQSMAERYFGADEVIGIIRIKQMENSSKLGSHPYDRQYKTYYVTERDQHTLAFLEKKGLTSLFEREYTVTEVRTQRYTPRFFSVGYNRAVSYVFFSCDNVLQVYVDQSGTMSFSERLTNGTTAVPEAEWDTYIQNSRSVALMTRPGVMVQIMLTNAEGEQKLVTRYLYDEDMPAS